MTFAPRHGLRAAETGHDPARIVRHRYRRTYYSDEVVDSLSGVRALSLVILSLALVACQPAAAALPADVANAQVIVELRDYSVKTSLASIPAGTVKIGIRNLAGMAHDLVVLKTETAFDKLPIDGPTAKAKEEGRVGGVEAIGAGRATSLTLDLAPGSYVLLCNVAGHYQLGMRTPLRVD